MKVTGIIVEYNPFHNGHRYHIEKARELTDPDVLVAVMSGNYCQRGDISIIDKFQKTQAALENGVDLVIELPYIDTVQNAYVFGSKAVSLLDKVHADHLVFGSETNNLEELKQYASMEIDVTRLKELLHDGHSYPKAYGLLARSLYPNDILAVTYLKALQKTGITPVSIQRTNSFQSTEMAPVASARAIREAIRKNEDYSLSTPLTISEPLYIDLFYPFLRHLLITLSEEELSHIFLMSEGIENLLKKNAQKYWDYEEFINASISRRYTRSRLQRILLHLLGHVTKEEEQDLEKEDYLRILGFNTRGQELLKELKKEEDIDIITQFKKLPEKQKALEWKMAQLYASLMKDPEGYIRKELKGPFII